MDKIKSIIFFLIPNSKNWNMRFWRNPYYFFPVFFTLLIACAAPSLYSFLKTYIVSIFIYLFYLTFTRTREPFFLIEVLLVLTKYFVGFADARVYCGIITFLMCIIIPIFSYILSYVLCHF